MDLPRVAELLSVNRTEPVTVEALRAFEERLARAGSSRILITEDGGRIVCFGRATRLPDEPEYRRKLMVATDPAFRNRGFGAAMFEALLDPGIVDLRADVREDDAPSLRFVASRGFEVTDHHFESVLDLPSVDESEFDVLVGRAEASGVRFFSYSETAMDETAERMLWSVNEETSVDQPTSEPDSLSFDAWRQMVSAADWFAPEGQIIAAVGDEWVGLGAVGEMTPGGFYNLFTGVRSAYRGRGIATALKALGIRYARSRNGRILRTNNHRDNAAMLAINSRFGYRPLPGWYAMKKEIPLATL